MRDKSYSSEKAYYVTTFAGYPDQYYLTRPQRLQESPFLPHGAIYGDRRFKGKTRFRGSYYGARNKDFVATIEEANVNNDFKNN